MEIETNRKIEELSRDCGTARSKRIRRFICEGLRRFPELLTLSEFSHAIDLINSSFGKIEEKSARQSWGRI
jgi:hypothetical protein